MRFTNSLVASALAALASAQTFTTCDPTNVTLTCPNDPAMAANFETDFKAGADKITGWKQTAGTLKYTSEGAEFTVAKKGDSPTIQSETNLLFGTVEVKCKAAVGQGIISSIVLQSADRDEVDWEWIGIEQGTVQMNYFGKGNTTTYDRMIRANVAGPMASFHTYKLDWTAERLIYSIDGVEMRTLNYADANGGKNYPQTPSNVRIGIWAGGDSEDAGTVEWAGGKTDYSKAPFTMVVESVKVTNASPGKEYKWTDHSGSWQSIEVIGKGDTEGAPQNSLTLGASASGTGGGVGTGIAAPTQTGVAPASSESAHASSSCTGGTKAPSTTAAAHSTSAPSNGTAPCSCGVETVIVTGYPPSSTAVAPVPSTSAVPSTTLATSTASPLKSSSVSSSVSVPPAVTVPAPSAPPYPTTTGLITDSAPAPSGSGAPTGGYTMTGPQPTSTPLQFTAGASYPTAVPLAGLAAAALLFV